MVPELNVRAYVKSQLSACDMVGTYIPPSTHIPVTEQVATDGQWWPRGTATVLVQKVA